MKVFISWSGARSKAVAEILDEWLQCVLQAVDPWMSSKDIDRGSLWFSEISDQLADTKLGIVCLTQDNKEKPWILFESGALAKGLSSSRVCTFLIDLDPADVGNPLAQFNHTFPSKDGVYELLRTINSSLGSASLKESVLEKVFDTYWPQFKDGFADALKNNEPESQLAPRSEEDMLTEVLTSVRRLDRRLREVEVTRNHSMPEEREISDYHRRKRSRPDPVQATIFIQRLVDKGVSPAEIEEQGLEIGIPEPFLQDKMRELIVKSMNSSIPDKG